jgi:hypothetical protein
MASLPGAAEGAFPLSGEILLRFLGVRDGLGARDLARLEQVSSQFSREYTESAAKTICDRRPDKGRAPRWSGRRWLAVLRQLELLQRRGGPHLTFTSHTPGLALGDQLADTAAPAGDALRVRR